MGSETTPLEAGQIRKGGHIVIKNRPCKVIDVSTSKTGKHGHAKCHFVAIDIFTGKKLEDLVPSSHNTSVPFIKKEQLQCIDIDDEDFCSLMLESGDMRQDLKCPDDDVGQQMRDMLAAETEFTVDVLSAMGEEKIMGCKAL